MSETSAAKSELVTHECAQCAFVALGFLARCPSCKRTSTMFERPGLVPTKMKPRSKWAGLGAKKSDGELEGGDVVTLADAMEDPENLVLRRLQTWEPFDYVTDGGPIERRSILMLGDRGVGKSTVCLHVCAGFLAHNVDENALYCSAEQDLAALVVSCRDIGATPSDRFAFLPLPNKQITRVLEVADKRKPKILVCDSLQAYAGDALDTLTRLRGWAHRNRAVLLALTHMNKEGVAAGANKIQQDVDGLFELRRPEPGQLVGGANFRLLECVDKHRNSRDTLAAALLFGDRGLEIVELFDSNDPKKKVRRGTSAHV